MGLLKKLLGTADRVYQAEGDLEHAVFRDRSFERAAALAQSGDPGTAVVTGIQRRLNDSTTDSLVRLEWYAPELRAGAVRFGDAIPPALRLGSTVRIRTDGDKVALDPAAMAAVPSAPADPGRSSRKTPDQGVSDTALDARVLSRLKKWPAETAVVVSFQRVGVFGMPSDNWDVVVRRGDNSLATINRDNVPPYARWYVHPGAELPIVVDPKDPGRAQGNWPLLAEQRAVAGGTWEDPPPQGSIAESLFAAPAGTPTPAAGMGSEAAFDPAPEPGSADAIEGITVEQCARIEHALSQVAPGDKDGVASEQHGVPAGRWTAIHGAWQARIRTDWRVGAAYGQAYEDASEGR